MERYAVDIDPEQIVRWIRDENNATPCKFRINAIQAFEHRAIPHDDARLGDEEREDLTEIATVVAIEIAPVPATDGWVLTVTVEDEIGPRPVKDGMREIDITSFYDQFLRIGRGTAVWPPRSMGRKGRCGSRACSMPLRQTGNRRRRTTTLFRNGERPSRSPAL